MHVTHNSVYHCILGFKIGPIQVRLRFTRRDAEVIAGMTQFGDITDRGTLTSNFQL